jgi:hypothetical protein
MSRQLTYSYQIPKGTAGSLVDLSHHSIDSRTNGEPTADVLLFGMGVVQGNRPGDDVLIPTGASTGDQFEGIAMTGYIKEMDREGAVSVGPKDVVGVLRWGRAWVRVADGVTPGYGDALCLVIDGDEAGYFTNDDGSGDNLAIHGRFLDGLGSGNIAPVELYNQMAQ